AAADPTPALVAGLSAAERADLLARLSDAQVRALLLDYLEAQPAPGGGAGGDLGEIMAAGEQFLLRVSEGAGRILSHIPDVPGLFGFAAAKLSEGRSL